MKGICKLCYEKRELQKSHAIPKTFFRDISTTSPNGQMYHIYPETLEIKIQGDQYTDYQLCKNCESFLNENYEAYAISVLRGKNTRCKIITNKKYDIYTDIDITKINVFILSVFWRFYNSNHKYFKNYSINSSLNSSIRDCILGSKMLGELKILIQIKKFYPDNELHEDQLNWIIRLPWKKNNSLNMIFGGYIFSLTFGQQSYKEKKLKIFNDELKSCIYLYKTRLSEHTDIIQYTQRSKIVIRNKKET